MTVVRGWWNGQRDERARQRVQIREDADGWWVDHFGPYGRYEYVRCTDASQAGAEAHRFLARGSRWRAYDPTS